MLQHRHLEPSDIATVVGVRYAVGVVHAPVTLGLRVDERLLRVLLLGELTPLLLTPPEVQQGVVDLLRIRAGFSAAVAG